MNAPTPESISKNFAQAAPTYSQSAVVQRQMRQELTDLLVYSLLAQYGYGPLAAPAPGASVKSNDTATEVVGSRHVEASADSVISASATSASAAAACSPAGADSVSQACSPAGALPTFTDFMVQGDFGKIVEPSSFELMMQPLKENPLATLGADFRRRLAAYNLDEPGKKEFVMADLGCGANLDSVQEFWAQDWFRRTLLVWLLKNQQFPHSMPGFKEDLQKLLLWYQYELRTLQKLPPKFRILELGQPSLSSFSGVDYVPPQHDPVKEKAKWRDLAHVRLDHVWYHLGGRWHKSKCYALDLVTVSEQQVSASLAASQALGGKLVSSLTDKLEVKATAEHVSELSQFVTKMTTSYPLFQKLQLLPVQASLEAWLVGSASASSASSAISSATSSATSSSAASSSVNIPTCPKLNLAFSNAMWQWLDNPAASAQQVQAHLVRGGYFALGTFVAGNLDELTQAGLGSLTYPSVEQVLSDLRASGLEVIAHRAQSHTLHFADLSSLLSHFKQTGVNAGSKPLTKSSLALLQKTSDDQGYPLTWKYLLVIAKRQ